MMLHKSPILAAVAALFAAWWMGVAGAEFLQGAELQADGPQGAGQVTVVIGSQATPLERLAADELAGQFRRLFAAEVTVSTQPPPRTGAIVLLGRPETNAELKRALGEDWPPLADQAFTIRGFRKGPQSGLVVVGGSPAATLWAVYELGHHFGIRYLLREDIFPETPLPLKLSEIKISQAPLFRTRAWQTIGDAAMGPESWSLEEHRRLLAQLAKLKFNRVVLSLQPWQPFVHYQFQDVAKRTGVLWQGQQFPIPRDTPGRTALGDVTQFDNPDFAGTTTYQQRLAAGTTQAQGILDEAHRLGMTVGIQISPLEFPREFATLLPGAPASRDTNNLLVAPGAQQAWNDPLLKKLVAAKIRAYLNTYPQTDALYVTLPDFPGWDQQFETAWEALARQDGTNLPPLSDLLAAASKRPRAEDASGNEESLKSDLVSLAFLQDLLRDTELLQRPDGRRVELEVVSIAPELFPWLDDLLPADAGSMSDVAGTIRRVAEFKEDLARTPADKVRCSLKLPLTDVRLGILSQSPLRRLESLLGQIRHDKWDGYCAQVWMLAELDPTVVYLARGSWDPNLTPRQAHDDLMTTITGKQSVADRLWLGFGHIEVATELIDKNDRDFAFPGPGMLMKLAQPEPAPKWWSELKEQYTQAMVELYRSHDGTHPRARRTLFYWAKRSEFVLEYLACLEAVRQAAQQRKSGDLDQAAEQYEIAIEQLYNAMDTLSDIARDSGDRGLIAVLNAYAYRSLMADYQKLNDE